MIRIISILLSLFCVLPVMAARTDLAEQIQNVQSRLAARTNVKKLRKIIGTWDLQFLNPEFDVVMNIKSLTRQEGMVTFTYDIFPDDPNTIIATDEDGFIASNEQGFVFRRRLYFTEANVFGRLLYGMKLNKRLTKADGIVLTERNRRCTASGVPEPDEAFTCTFLAQADQRSSFVPVAAVKRTTDPDIVALPQVDNLK